ncbi:hypothetical protein NMY22_g15210 [Coprinellus aureogranulatus]|nr:hypothetical protein NMY22_g15210 [Coprinellus aureogranulatus]
MTEPPQLGTYIRFDGVFEGVHNQEIAGGRVIRANSVDQADGGAERLKERYRAMKESNSPKFCVTYLFCAFKKYANEDDFDQLARVLFDKLKELPPEVAVLRFPFVPVKSSLLFAPSAHFGGISRTILHDCGSEAPQAREEAHLQFDFDKASIWFGPLRQHGKTTRIGLRWRLLPVSWQLGPDDCDAAVNSDLVKILTSGPLVQRLCLIDIRLDYLQDSVKRVKEQVTLTSNWHALKFLRIKVLSHPGPKPFVQRAVLWDLHFTFPPVSLTSLHFEGSPGWNQNHSLRFSLLAHRLLPSGDARSQEDGSLGHSHNSIPLPETPGLVDALPASLRDPLNPLPLPNLRVLRYKSWTLEDLVAPPRPLRAPALVELDISFTCDPMNGQNPDFGGNHDFSDGDPSSRHGSDIVDGVMSFIQRSKRRSPASLIHVFRSMMSTWALSSDFILPLPPIITLVSSRLQSLQPGALPEASSEAYVDVCTYLANRFSDSTCILNAFKTLNLGMRGCDRVAPHDTGHQANALYVAVTALRKLGTPRPEPPPSTNPSTMLNNGRNLHVDQATQVGARNYYNNSSFNVNVQPGGHQTTNTEIHAGTYVHNEIQKTTKTTLQSNAALAALHNSADRFDAPSCWPETREAVQEDIISWITDGEDDDPKKIMWLHGPAGSGKTAIAGSVAATCHSLRILAGSFFFSSYAGAGERSSKRGVVATLAHCLTCHNARLAESILTSIERDPSIFRKRLRDQCQQLLIEPFYDVGEALDLSSRSESLHP